MSYGPLPSHVSGEGVDQIETKGSTTRSTRWGHLCRLFALLSSVVIPLAVIYVLLDRRIDQQKPESCGGSSTEALSLGCHFDVMSFAWLPQRCFDQELTTQFLALRDWKWFLDPDGVHVADINAVLKGEYPQLHVTQEYHMYHCTYMWRKMHRALLSGKLVDGYIGSMMHTGHCEMMLVDRESTLNDTNTMILTKYVECPSTNARLGRAGWYRMVNGVRTAQSFEHH